MIKFNSSSDYNYLRWLKKWKSQINFYLEKRVYFYCSEEEGEEEEEEEKEKEKEKEEDKDGNNGDEGDDKKESEDEEEDENNGVTWKVCSLGEGQAVARQDGTWFHFDFLRSSLFTKLNLFNFEV